MPAAGNVGGVGFRPGALPIILTATDTGFAFQPKGETTVTGLNGVTLPVSALSETSRPDTPFSSGAGLQETVTGLNALGALVIGLGTNPEATLDPRQGLESLSKLTGAVNHSTTTIDNGTADPIAPGDPLYFQISSGFGASVANGVVNAIQNAASNVAVNITLQASDPRVKIINHTGTRNGIGSGQTATFDVEFIGDGAPRRFDLQFVRAGTNVVLGSIPVVIGTPIAGNDTFTTAEDTTLTLSANGSFVYTPTAGYSGADSFTYVANDGLLNSNVATVAIQVTPVIVTGGTKFYVVDASARGTFGYDANGAATTRQKLNAENEQPRGIATNKDGSKLWDIDEKGDVFVYNNAGKLLGSSTAKGLGKPEGITTDGTNIWIVDDDSNRVFYFAGAAARLSGKVSATSSIALNRNNANAMDVVTDGTHLWVVNDTAKVDSVFRYTVSGVLEGSWQIDSANKTPTGLTIDPNDVNHIWIVDAGTDRVY